MWRIICKWWNVYQPRLDPLDIFFAQILLSRSDIEATSMKLKPVQHVHCERTSKWQLWKHGQAIAMDFGIYPLHLLIGIVFEVALSSVAWPSHECRDRIQWFYLGSPHKKGSKSKFYWPSELHPGYHTDWWHHIWHLRQWELHSHGVTTDHHSHDWNSSSTIGSQEECCKYTQIHWTLLLKAVGLPKAFFPINQCWFQRRDHGQAASLISFMGFSPRRQDEPTWESMESNGTWII